MSLFDTLKEKLSGVRKRWSSGIVGLFRGDVGDDFWDDLEDLLIAGDVGFETSESLLEELRDYYRRTRCSGEELLCHFRRTLIRKLRQIPRMGEPLLCGEGGLSVILLVGVNGSGKTTTAGKLAQLYKGRNKKVMLAAADTFRAAAIDQLQVWGQRAGVRVVAQRQGSDSAAVVYDALAAAKSSGADVLIVDTAGRLQSKHNLMEELNKIYRVVQREAGDDRMELSLIHI